MSFKKRKLDDIQTEIEPEHEEGSAPDVEPVIVMEEAHNDSKLIKSIRRKANPDNWKQVVRKKLRQAGQEYVNAQGKVMAERRVHEGCGTGCYLNCSQRFTAEQRQLIHNTFWKLTDEQKNNFYWKYTSRVEPKRRRPSVGETSKRGCTFKYRFEVRGELLPVCSKFFFTTLDISARRIYYFYEHCYQEDICMPREPLRGKTRKRSVPNLASRLDEIREHIKSFPSMRLGSSKKRYLPAELNLTRMYKQYTECSNEPLKQHWYSKVFHEEFNLGFRPAKTVEKSDKGAVRAVARKTKDSGVQCVNDVNVVGTDAHAITSCVDEVLATESSELTPAQGQWEVSDVIPLTTTVLDNERLQTVTSQWDSGGQQVTTTIGPQDQIYPGYVELRWVGDMKVERLN